MGTLASTVATTVAFHYSYRYLPHYHQPHFIMSLSYWFLFLLSSLNSGRSITNELFIYWYRSLYSNLFIYWFVLVIIIIKVGYHSEDAIQSNYRWIYVTWFLAMIVLVNAYRTVLFAILTVPHYFQLVNNVDELASRTTEINVNIRKDSSVEDLFLVLLF